MKECYYLSLLDREQQKIYHTIQEGLTAVSPSFPVPRISMEELATLFFYVRLDCPEIFYAVSFRCQAASNSSSWDFLPEYMFPKKQIMEQKEILSSRVRKLVRPMENLSPAEKVRAIHDFLCTDIHYDKLKKPYSHEIIGALGHGVAVCEGISKSFKILCDALNVPCLIAVSEAAPEKGIRYRHAWNIVRLDGQPYHFDATFDNTLSQDVHSLRYDYFRLNDSQIFRDHQPGIVSLPECHDGHHDWYSEQKLAFGDLEKLKSRVHQTIKKKKDFSFRWNAGYLSRETAGEIVRLVSAEAESLGVSVLLSANYPQSVFHLSLTSEAVPTELRYEQANEAEND